MTLVRANPAGWALFELLTSTQMNAVDSQLPYALDGNAGGTYTPTAELELDGTNIAGNVLHLTATGPNVDYPLLIDVDDTNVIAGIKVLAYADAPAAEFFHGGAPLSIAGNPTGMVTGIGHGNTGAGNGGRCASFSGGDASTANGGTGVIGNGGDGGSSGNGGQGVQGTGGDGDTGQRGGIGVWGIGGDELDGASIDTGSGAGILGWGGDGTANAAAHGVVGIGGEATAASNYGHGGYFSATGEKAGLKGFNSYSTLGIGVEGEGTLSGVDGVGNTNGVGGRFVGGSGGSGHAGLLVSGGGTALPVDPNNGTALRVAVGANGNAINATSTSSPAITAVNTGGAGIVGQGFSNGTGVSGLSNGSGPGIFGQSVGTGDGVWGYAVGVSSPPIPSGEFGVVGAADGGGSSNAGVLAYAEGSATALRAYADGSGYAASISASSGSNYAMVLSPSSSHSCINIAATFGGLGSANIPGTGVAGDLHVTSDSIDYELWFHRGSGGWAKCHA